MNCYEDAIKRIEEIAMALEREEVSLEKSIELYKEGMELTIFCRKILDVSEKEVLQLKEGFDAAFNVTPFESMEG